MPDELNSLGHLPRLETEMERMRREDEERRALMRGPEALLGSRQGGLLSPLQGLVDYSRRLEEQQAALMRGPRMLESLSRSLKTDSIHSKMWDRCEQPERLLEGSLALRALEQSAQRREQMERDTRLFENRINAFRSEAMVRIHDQDELRDKMFRRLSSERGGGSVRDLACFEDLNRHHREAMHRMEEQIAQIEPIELRFERMLKQLLGPLLATLSALQPPPPPSKKPEKWRRARARMLTLLDQDKLPASLNQTKKLLAAEGFGKTTTQKAAHQSDRLCRHFKLKQAAGPAETTDLLDELSSTLAGQFRRLPEEAQERVRDMWESGRGRAVLELLETLASDVGGRLPGHLQLIENADRDSLED